jgi:Calcineurin-like phosphoesterase
MSLCEAMSKSRSLLFFGILGFSMFLTSSLTNYASADFNFPAVGDWGCNSNTKSTANNVIGRNPEQVFGLGDYSYVSTTTGATCWLNIILPFDAKTKIAIGNHEDDDSEGYQQYKSHFGLGNPYYSFNYNNVHVLVMDTDRGSFSPGSAQHTFVKNDLLAASQNLNIKWIIVYLHKPLYTSPNTCGSSSCSNTGSTANSLRNTYHSLFDQRGVDVVLQGHVHNFQRTFPIKYSGGSTPTVTNFNIDFYRDPQGEIFVVVGTGGINFHGLSGKASWVKVQQDDKFGILDIKITNNGYTLEGRYHRNDGVIIDKFTIIKTGAAAYSYGPSLTLSGKQ